MTIDWLGALPCAASRTSRPSSRRCRRGPSASRCCGRAKGGDDTTADRRRSGGGRRCAGSRRSMPTSCSSRRSSVSATFGTGGPLRVVVDPIDGSVNAKRGIPFFSLSLAVAEGPSMGDVVFGYVYDFGAREEWTATRGHGAMLDGAPLTAPGPKDPIEILSFEATTTAFIAEQAPAMRRSGGAPARHGLARALALPSGGRPGRRRVLAEAGPFDRHRGRSAARARAGLRDRAVRGSAVRRSALDLVGRSRVVAAATSARCAEVAAALSVSPRV